MEHPVPSPIQETSGRPFVVPAAAGLVAAVVGGVAWGYTVKFSDYELGILAWAIGFVAGTAVVLAAGGARGRRLQVTAVVAALLGIALGKYLGYALVVQEAAAEFGADVSLFGRAMLESFRDDLSLVLGWFDALWVGLATWSAWRIPQAAEPPPEQPPE